MKSEANQKRSESMKRVWVDNREHMILSRTSESKAKQSAKIKQHFLEHPEHRTAISVAQKKKWSKYKKALAYCKQAGISLD